MAQEIEVKARDIVRMPPNLLERIGEPKPLPEKLDGLFTLRGWAESLVAGRPYAEINPDYLATKLMIQTLTAPTPDEVMSSGKVKHLQQAIADVPGAGTGPVEITDLYVSSSDFSEGAPCYVIFDTVSLLNGNAETYTTGATQVQAQLLRLLWLGVWPIRCEVKRIERKDKGGHYLFWVFPPDDL